MASRRGRRRRRSPPSRPSFDGTVSRPGVSAPDPARRRNRDPGGVPGGGVSGLRALARRPAFRYAPGVALAAVGTLAFGAVLGPEAPLIALGSAVGLAVTLFVRLEEREQQVVATAGSFSAISALFGGPLVAGMLLLEGSVGLGAAAIPMLVPGLVAAAVGYTIFVGLGDWGGLDTTAIAIPGLPEYDGTSVKDLLIAVAVGVAAAAVIAVVRELARNVTTREKRVPMPALLLSGGLAVGLLAQLADVLGADLQDVLFSGQTAVPHVVVESSASVVLVLFVAKGLGYAISLGCGFRGGPVFPAVFLGVALATLPVIALDVSPTLAVAVGTAAGMAAMTRLLLASLIFALLVGSAGVDAIPAAVLAGVAAWVTAAALERRAEAAIIRTG